MGKLWYLIVRQECRCYLERFLGQMWSGKLMYVLILVLLMLPFPQILSCNFLVGREWIHLGHQYLIHKHKSDLSIGLGRDVFHIYTLFFMLFKFNTLFPCSALRTPTTNDSGPLVVGRFGGLPVITAISFRKAYGFVFLVSSKLNRMV